MGIAERRQNEIEAIKRKIIDAARSILIYEGYEKLSIRKIADKIEYSPGIIYHYFKDKGEIMSSIVKEGYEEILRSIEKHDINYDEPEKTMLEILKEYIYYMIERPEYFKAILMNNIENVQDKVNVLKRGISKERKSIEKLTSLVELCIKKGRFKEYDPELTAQIIWTSTHGLISRLVLEKDVTHEQRDRLIEHHFKLLLNGLLK